jgi:hypothetical protein
MWIKKEETFIKVLKILITKNFTNFFNKNKNFSNSSTISIHTVHHWQNKLNLITKILENGGFTSRNYIDFKQDGAAVKNMHVFPEN